MADQLLFKNFGKHYDLIYSSKNYKQEANKIKKLISKYKKSSGKELLEVACGTGRYLKYFKKGFSCTGVDINRGVLKVAKKNIKGIDFVQANMINMKLNKKFDVILCLFASIGYVKTYENLRKTIKKFSEHLKKGGVIIIEPWFNKKTYKTGFHSTIYRGNEVDIVRLRDSKIFGNNSLIDMHYLLAEKNKPVKYLVDKHTLGLFNVDKTLKLMRTVGLKTTFVKNGLVKEKGLYVGVKN
ncbi:MAG: class I SAM-dependent methyltransferase [Nanoarchaeota archaeon]